MRHLTLQFVFVLEDKVHTPFGLHAVAQEDDPGDLPADVVLPGTPETSFLCFTGRYHDVCFLFESRPASYQGPTDKQTTGDHKDMLRSE